MKTIVRYWSFYKIDFIDDKKLEKKQVIDSQSLAFFYDKYNYLNSATN